MSAPATDTSGDTTQPRITAQYPSACLYTFNTQGFDAVGAVLGTSGLTTLSDNESDCLDVMAARDLNADNNALEEDPGSAPEPTIIFQNPRANSFPLNASPSLTFSEPLDPSSFAGNIQLFIADSTGTPTGSPIPAALRSEGTSVVIDPTDPLQPDTQYIITVGNSVTDLAGNGIAGNYLSNAIVSDITFNTEPMVIPPNDDGSTDTPPVRQTAPFLTVLTPGLPCALDASTGDYLSGGNVAGRCVGDSPRGETMIAPNPSNPQGETISASPELIYDVFNQPANVPIEARFSKPVTTGSIVLANGCLIGGDGSNAATEGSFAVQTIDSNGQCTGIIDGGISTLNPGDALTRGFTFRPVSKWTVGQRYWVVFCGGPNSPENVGTSDCVTQSTILGVGGRRLNTSPLVSTGTEITGTRGNRVPDPTCAPNAPLSGGNLSCYNQDATGGPDLIMPFDGAPETSDFYATTLALPETDTNGNGFFDNDPPVTDGSSMAFSIIGGTNTHVELDSDGSQRDSSPYDDLFGREHAQLANSVFTFNNPLLAYGFAAPTDAAFLSGGQSIAIRQLESGEDCSPAMNVTLENGTPDDPSDDVAVIGNTAPSSCIPVSLLQGGYITINNFGADAGLTPGGTVQAGRILLRFPSMRDSDGNSTGQPQTGYIVPQCSGTLKSPVDPNYPTANITEQPYNYAPCFVANLTVTANGPDSVNRATNTELLLQQDLHVQAFGPVAFEQNGRLVVSTKNSNTFRLIISVPGSPGVIASTTYPGAQSLQLVGPAIHGDVALPIR